MEILNSNQAIAISLMMAKQWDMHIMKVKTVSGWKGFTSAFSVFHKIFRRKPSYRHENRILYKKTLYNELVY